jgi:hypothetical protein
VPRRFFPPPNLATCFFFLYCEKAPLRYDRWSGESWRVPTLPVSSTSPRKEQRAAGGDITPERRHFAAPLYSIQISEVVLSAAQAPNPLC